ncbi:MAG: hypothetical protein JXM73_01230 [Anaerolineae bacterium]|nr:hypothetical protein [Anaerolineae bacterium]
MKGTDKFLIAIVAGVVILVVVAFILTLLRVEAPQYQADDTPQGVAYNYLLAIQRQDYERARGYLSPTLRGYPATVEQFAADVERFTAYIDYPPYDVNWYKRELSVTIVSTYVDGDHASIGVRRARLDQGDLFDGGQGSYVFTVALRREDGAWKVAWAEWCWDRCWANPDGPDCR